MAGLIIGLVLLAVCGGGLVWLLLHPARTKPVSVPLEVVSKLWLSEDPNEMEEASRSLREALTGKTGDRRPKTKDEPRSHVSGPQSLILTGKLQSPIAGPRSSRPQPSWQNSDTTAFYREFIEPYEKTIGEKALKAIEEILKLLDREGDCSSVASGESWEEEELNLYSALERVSLREHSFNTARHMLEILRREYADFELVVGKGLIAALGHDLGKIPRLRRAFYSTGDHPINSAVVVSNLAKELPYREEVVKAIRSHHETTNDPFTLLLKEADRKAREEEITESKLLKGAETQEESQEKTQADENEAQEETEPVDAREETGDGRPETKDGRGEAKTSGPSPRSPVRSTDLSWLNLDDLLSRIEPYINRYVDRKGNILDETPVTGEIWWAFSTKDGLVYVMPALVSRLVGQMAREKGLSPFAYSLAKDREFQREVEKTVASRLMKEKGCIPDLIKEGYSGARFVVSFSGKDMVGFYLPIRAEAFGVGVGELEARKGGVLKKIVKVRPRWVS